MPSNSQESTGFGFLPACPTPRSPEKPRGSPTGRPQKARAVEMDETLNMTGSLKGKLENASKRQQVATQKLKDNKSNALQLKERVGSMEQELEIARAEAERTRVDPHVKADYDKVQRDHSTLQATHAWTKSSLDSTLAAQEEYRKGYTTLQAAYRKAKAELEEKERKAESAKGARLEAAQIQASLPEKEAEFKQDLADAQECLRNIINRQKKKSQAVVDRMLSGQSSTLVQLTFSSWQKAISDEKFWRENAKSLEEAQKRLQDYQGKKKAEASKVLDRMSAGNNTSLTSMMLQYWNKFVQEAKKEREESKSMHDTLKNAKLSARKTLEANLNGSATGLLTNAWKDWVNYFRECKKVNDMKSQAEAKMKEYQAKKKGEQASVIERMAGEQSQALMTRMFMCWAMTCLDESAARHEHNDLTNQVDDLESKLKEMRQAFVDAQDQLEDTNEEIIESRRKNGLLREELKSIVDLSENMDSSLRAMAS